MEISRERGDKDEHIPISYVINMQPIKKMEKV